VSWGDATTGPVEEDVMAGCPGADTPTSLSSCIPKTSTMPDAPLREDKYSKDIHIVKNERKPNMKKTVDLGLRRLNNRVTV